MSVADQIRTWRNCLRRISAGKNDQWEQGAKLIIARIELVWKVIGMDPSAASGYFRWPSTIANSGPGSLDEVTFVEEGMLSLLGYRVGSVQGEPNGMRHLILKHAFERVLPPCESPAYMRQWHDPGTPQRLHKLADTIAAFIRNAKRRKAQKLDEAIADWSDDLNMLYERFYVGRFAFAWPRTQP